MRRCSARTRKYGRDGDRPVSALVVGRRTGMMLWVAVRPRSGFHTHRAKYAPLDANPLSRTSRSPACRAETGSNLFFSAKAAVRASILDSGEVGVPRLRDPLLDRRKLTVTDDSVLRSFFGDEPPRAPALHRVSGKSRSSRRSSRSSSGASVGDQSGYEPQRMKASATNGKYSATSISNGPEYRLVAASRAKHGVRRALDPDIAVHRGDEGAPRLLQWDKRPVIPPLLRGRPRGNGNTPPGRTGGWLLESPSFPRTRESTATMKAHGFPLS